MLHLLRTVSRGEEDAVHVLERSTYGRGVGEVADGQLEVVAKLLHGPGRIPDEGANVHATSS